MRKILAMVVVMLSLCPAAMAGPPVPAGESGWWTMVQEWWAAVVAASIDDAVPPKAVPDPPAMPQGFDAESDCSECTGGDTGAEIDPDG